jgi:hypothetical protein
MDAKYLQEKLHYVCDWRMACRRIILADFSLWTSRKISGNVRENSSRKPRENDSNANRVRQTRKDDCTVVNGSILRASTCSPPLLTIRGLISAVARNCH